MNNVLRPSDIKERKEKSHRNWKQLISFISNIGFYNDTNKITGIENPVNNQQ